MGEQRRGMGSGWLSRRDGVVSLAGVEALRETFVVDLLRNAGYAYRTGEVVLN